MAESRIIPGVPTVDVLELRLTAVEAAILYELLGHGNNGTEGTDPLLSVSEELHKASQTGFIASFASYPSVVQTGYAVTTKGDGWGYRKPDDLELKVANEWEEKNRG